MPVATRDLASFDLWERSLERSQRRRVLAEAARKQLMRRKTASVAMSAAVAAAPMAPSVAAAAALSKDGTAKLARKLERRHVDRVLLERGDSSSAVIELQRALRIPDDGIYGPQTQWAVETFQQREGLDVTGDVNVRTWLKLFPTDAVIYVAPAAAKAMGVDTGDGPSWTAVKASDVAATQAATPPRRWRPRRRRTAITTRASHARPPRCRSTRVSGVTSSRPAVTLRVRSHRRSTGTRRRHTSTPRRRSTTRPRAFPRRRSAPRRSRSRSRRRRCRGELPARSSAS